MAANDRYDYLFDAVDKLNWLRGKRLLKPSGTYGCMDMGPFTLNLWLSIGFRLLRNKRFVFGLPSGGAKFVRFLKERLAAGEVSGVFDRQYPLEEVVNAHRYVKTGQKVGIVRLKISEA